MNEDRRRSFLIGGLVVVAIGAAAFFFFNRGEEDTIPSAPNAIYYTGPMKSKSGKNEYSDINGKLLTEAEAKAGRDQWLKDHPKVAEMDKKRTK